MAMNTGDYEETYRFAAGYLIFFHIVTAAPAFERDSSPVVHRQSGAGLV
jgi:hypothetical protein